MPTARKASPPSGTRMMYAAALATCDTVPAKATENTTQDTGTRDTETFMAADRKPVRSAIATPMITATMVPIGPNEAKFSTAVDTAMASPSPLSRFWTTTVSPSAGETTETPAAASPALVTPRMAARIQNSQNGCGRALPTRSTTASARRTRGSRSGSVPGVSGVPAVPGLAVAVMTSLPVVRAPGGTGAAASRRAGSPTSPRGPRCCAWRTRRRSSCPPPARCGRRRAPTRA